MGVELFEFVVFFTEKDELVFIGICADISTINCNNFWQTFWDLLLLSLLILLLFITTLPEGHGFKKRKGKRKFGV